MFTGGRQVGHVTHNLLLIQNLSEDGWEVHYIGDKEIEYQEIKSLVRGTIPFGATEVTHFSFKI